MWIKEIDKNRQQKSTQSLYSNVWSFSLYYVFYNIVNRKRSRVQSRKYDVQKQGTKAVTNGIEICSEQVQNDFEKGFNASMTYRSDIL